MHCTKLTRSAALLFLLCGSLRAADDGAPVELTPEQLKFFETDVRPLLIEHCFECHAAEKQKGGLRLDARDLILTGGDSGPAIVTGEPEESLLIEAVRYESFEMPPKGRLPEKDVATLVRWIQDGAPWPNGETIAPARAESGITDEDRNHWAYRPLTDPDIPEVDDDDWSRTPIDRFVYRQLTDAALQPAEEADRVTLARRLYQQVIGLPPTPDQVDAFLSDDSEHAVENLIDRLLDSPQYGERWAVFWLDLVRFAESDGYKADSLRPHAWGYRDYVIRSLNSDKPYDRFLMEQLAGDELAPGDPEALAATGYLRHGIYEYNQRDAERQWQNMLNDITDNVGDTFLAMGMGCARCHDHKFDPILQKDYYRLQAFLVNVSFRDDVLLATAEEIERYRQQEAVWSEAAADVLASIAEIEQRQREKAVQATVSKFAPEIQAMWAKPASERTSYEKQIVQLVWLQVIGAEGQNASKLNKEDQVRWDELQQKLAQFDHLKPEPLPAGMTVTDIGPVAPVVSIDGKQRLGEIEPGFPTIFEAKPATIEPIPELPQSTGRRLALARWLAQPDHPLTSRVIVNRIWQEHFGTGLVSTTSDFGHLGEPPSHPELLDWLAVNFVNNGWSLKQLHREILSSATFRQTSLRPIPEAAVTSDPANRLLWRFPARRLSAEQIRDSMLSVSGELSLAEGGPGVDLEVPRRAVYLKMMRNDRDPVLDVFDFPDRITGTGERNVTTTPGQSLLMINGDWVLGRARRFADRVATEIPGAADSQIRHAYHLAFGRAPSERELQRAVRFVEQRGSPTALAKELESRMREFSATDSTALAVGEDDSGEPLRLENRDALPAEDFTVEAIVTLNSLYPDAAVRTIVSQWDSQTGHPGWSLGVTSTKSSFTPRNLILQLVGQTESGKRHYEVLPSGLLLELNRPYYVAVSVDLSDTSESGVRFIAQDLSEQNASVWTAEVPHTVVSGYTNDRALVIGGRDGTDNHVWHGLIDEVRLSRSALPTERLPLAAEDSSDEPGLVGWWRFNDRPHPLADSGPNSLDLSLGTDPQREALADFCHVLLNANEFLYVD